MPRSHNNNGRSRKVWRHIQLPHFMLDTAAWLSLSSKARSAFIEVAKIYDGSNNGHLAASSRTIGDRMGVSKNTAARALDELVEKGFLEITEDSAFSRKNKRAREYRLTLHKCDRTGDLPSKAFQRWKPDEKQNTVSQKAA